MSTSNKTIKAALKKVFVPHLTAEGFMGKYPQFVRKEDGALHLLSIQFDKWGGGFFLEFAAHPPGDKTMSWGEVVPESALTTAHAPFDTRARLQEDGADNSLRETWFRFENMDKEACEQLARRLVGVFPQVNEWLRTGERGANISAMDN